MKWNTKLYDDKHDFVSKYGEELMELLAPKSGETILDVGCGTGDLAKLISEKGALVTGIDSSREMIDAAKSKYPDIFFDLISATQINYEGTFDAVFSNATLHWIKESESAVIRFRNALKLGGRFVCEFGGKGNVNSILIALTNELQQNGYPDRANYQIWYFPSLSEYTTLLERNGFRVKFAAHFDRKTTLHGDDGMRNWLKLFGQPYFSGVSDQVVDRILTDVEKSIRATNYANGNWFADYVRLRIVAVRE